MQETRIQLANGYVQLPSEIDFPIDLSFAEININGTRTGGFSRAIDVDGTANNIKVLGGYFDVDLSNQNFNRNKKQKASVIQNGVEIFEGYLQLLEISRINANGTTNGKKISYKIFVFDEVSNFFNEMGDKELSELRFPEFSHTFNRAKIIESWSYTGGYVYPQFAKDDNIYTLRDFKPAIYEFEYFKKIFKANGYSFKFDELASDEIRLNKRIIPYNGKQGEDSITNYLKEVYTVRGEQASGRIKINKTTSPTYPNGFIPLFGYLLNAELATYSTNYTLMELPSIFEDAQNQYLPVTKEIKNFAGQGRTWNIESSYRYSLKIRAVNALGVAVDWKVKQLAGFASRCDVKVCLVAQSKTNPNKVVYMDTPQVAYSFTGTNQYFFSNDYEFFGDGINASTGNIGLLDDLESYDFNILVFATYYKANGSIVANSQEFIGLANFGNPENYLPMLFVTDTPSEDKVRLEFSIQISNFNIKATPDISELAKNSKVDLSVFIPKKIKQRDIISSIIKSYNLVLVPSQSNTKEIVIKTRDKYYQDGKEWDWTGKFDESQTNTITLLSNEAKKKQVLAYKEDKDELNTKYQGMFLETYGQTSVDLDNEYIDGVDKRELIYSPTPSVKAGLGFTLPAINGANPDNNVRVLLHNGKGSIYRYPFYDDILPNVAELEFIETYCLTSMFDNDTIPNFSIAFDAPKALFHTSQKGQTSNYLYNLHHQQEVSTINDGKKLTGYFNLTETDYQKLSKRMDWKIFIKDNGWFYISKIYGYNANKRTLTKVDLVTADEKLRLKYRKPIRPVASADATLGVATGKYFATVNADTNLIVGSEDVVIDGKYNYVSASKVRIIGNQNKVTAKDAVVIGDQNTIEVAGVKAIGNALNPIDAGVSIEGFGTNVSETKAVIKIWQDGVSSPNITVISNDFGGTLTATRVLQGVYTIDGFTSITGEIECTVNNVIAQNSDVIAYVDISTLIINTFTNGIASDDVLPFLQSCYITITKL